MASLFQVASSPAVSPPSPELRVSTAFPCVRNSCRPLVLRFLRRSPPLLPWPVSAALFVQPLLTLRSNDAASPGVRTRARSDAWIERSAAYTSAACGDLAWSSLSSLYSISSMQSTWLGITRPEPAPPRTALQSSSLASSLRSHYHLLVANMLLFFL